MLADSWESTVVSPETITGKIKPGMSIFLGTAGAEPRTMVRHLMTTEAKNLEDLELIQLVSFGDAISLQTLQSQKFRLTTFFFRLGCRRSHRRGPGGHDTQSVRKNSPTHRIPSGTD